MLLKTQQPPFTHTAIVYTIYVFREKMKNEKKKKNKKTNTSNTLTPHVSTHAKRIGVCVPCLFHNKMLFTMNTIQLG